MNIKTARSNYDLGEVTGVVIRIERRLERYLLFVRFTSNGKKPIALIWGKNMTTGFRVDDNVKLFELKKLKGYFLAQKGEVLQKEYCSFLSTFFSFFNPFTSTRSQR